MQKVRTWRALLGELIHDPRERQRIANELSINQVTLNRWVRGESSPRPQNLLRLLLALPKYRETMRELIEAEFPNFSTFEREEGLMWDESISIPAAFYKRVLHTLPVLPHVLRFPSLCDLILQQAIEQLDPNRLGMAIIVTCCMPPSSTIVRSLRERTGRGTSPWQRDLEQQAILLGAESLAGHVVSSGHLEANQRLREQFGVVFGYRGNQEESAVAAPIMHLGKIAGSFLVSSTQPDYFLPARCALIESYAELVALTFDPEDFYDPKSIQLASFPPSEVQLPYFFTFSQQVAQTMIQAQRSGKSLNILEAQQAVWQQIEEKLLSWNNGSNKHI